MSDGSSRVRVSVIVPTYNHEPYIRAALDGVLTQRTDFPWDVAVLEDCSTDGTREIVEAYRDLHPDCLTAILAPQNGKYMRALARAIETCRGDYISLVEGDDEWTDPRKLQRQVDFLDAHPECTLSFHNVEVWSQAERRSLGSSNPPDQAIFSKLEDLLPQNFIRTCSVMIRRNAIVPLPDWFENLIAGDVPLFLLAMRHGTAGYIDRVMARYRVHDGGLWSGLRHPEKLEFLILQYDQLLGRFGEACDERIRQTMVRRSYELVAERDRAPGSVLTPARVAEIEERLWESEKETALRVIRVEPVWRPEELLGASIDAPRSGSPVDARGVELTGWVLGKGNGGRGRRASPGRPVGPESGAPTAPARCGCGISRSSRRGKFRLPDVHRAFESRGDPFESRCRLAEWAPRASGGNPLRSVPPMNSSAARARISSACALLIAVLACGCLSPAKPQGPVIVFLVDTLRFDRMSAYGAGRPTSPAAAKLAAEGVRYDAAYSVAPWTRPSVASLFTSRWPAEVGAIGRWGGLAPEVPVMADEFRRVGWDTAAFCGQPNIYFRELGFRRGFSTFYPVHPGDDAADGTVSTADRVVEPAIHWIESRESSRFFLFIHVVDPHNGDISSNPNPYRHWIPGYENLFSGHAPMDLNSREWRLAKYDALVRQSDDQFARLRRALEAKGFWKKALVVYLSDHGEEFYEHGAVYHGQSLFEELVRVPLIVKGPGWGRPGAVEKSPVTLLDLLPSIADWAGFPRDPRWRGEAVDRASPNPSRAIYFSQELDRWRLYGMRRGRHKMIVSIHPPFRIEFDLERDPGEQGPIPNEPDLSNVLEAYRHEELASYGGLRIWKTGTVRAALSGTIEVPGPMPPYLSLPDRDRFPMDPRHPNELALAAEIDPRLPFELHMESFDGQPALTPHLTVLGTSIAVRNGPATQLSPSEMSEIVKRMRSLGYLGGD